ncbi:hypothetical protein S40285_03167 [Stachybotrys chlorohalonatus IBT 40285]|uniref:Zn(2)-C6 fungal-type domain-containing protein n=1 Tax=Stachybotrys chlorohalonatus (strain IBT 40285) TaxID=1283841 RepID=A0A084QI48_STAC4|nr:hypothetical protein S40285_03167 [Stachybotrys chlorohalonata IBT 40285]
MSSDVLNFNKPCSACRRRKVRCDKAQPCNNCVRHGVSCVYEASRESVASQELLHERVERLERIVEEMASLTLSNEKPKSTHKGSSSGDSSFSNIDEGFDASLDVRIQNLQQTEGFTMLSPRPAFTDNLLYDPPHLSLRSESVFPRGNSWPLPASSLITKVPRGIMQFHLPEDKEDALLKLFFSHVEPFIGIEHEGYVWQLIGSYRHGMSTCSRETEALMVAMQCMAATVLPATLIQENLGYPKASLKTHLQRATEVALEKADIMRSRNPVLFSALLYHITCKFHSGDCEAASTLLGLSGKIAKRIGLHRDPAYYGYAAWMVEVRRRLWGHLVCLDIQSTIIDGSDVLMTNLGDVQPALNVSSSAWTPARIVGREPGPEDHDGYTDSTGALVRRQITRTCYQIMERRKTTSSCEDLMPILDENEQSIRYRFLRHFDGSNPMHHVITQWSKAFIRALHVTILYSHAESHKDSLKCHSFDKLREQLYIDCLSCLEDLELGEAAAIPHHWQWAFRWPMPLYVIAGLLSSMARQPDHPDSERAWHQVDVVFRRYNNEDINMSKMPAWSAIETLCDQAMERHSGRTHSGRDYTKRVIYEDGWEECIDDSDMMKKLSGLMQGTNETPDPGLEIPQLDHQMLPIGSLPIGGAYAGSGLDVFDFFNMETDIDFPPLDLQ